MKKLSLLLSLLLVVFAVAAETVQLGNGTNSIAVLSSSANETLLQYQISNFEQTKVEIAGSAWYQIRLPKEGITQDKGFPELPVFNRSIIIDNSALMKLEIYDIQYQDFLLPVAPSKGVITRNIDPATVPYSFDKIYESKDFYPGQIAELSEPYILRDFRGITLKTSPFAYNPSTQTLRVYTGYKIRVYAAGTDTINTLSTSRSGISRDFSPLYENHFINWNSYRYTPVSDAFGKLLVICHTNYMSTILPYVNWKIQKGIPTELVQWSTIGTTAAQLQTYIQNRYTADPTIAYVQLVGDAPQIPSLSSGGGGSDPTFALVAGSDNYPDIFVGRFSAETAAQVTAQINKAIVYERDATTSDTWLNRAMGLASAEGGGSQGDNGESDITHMNNIRTDLINFGYTSVDQVYDPGAAASTVTTNVNAGRGFINYVGHGSDTSWVTTGFSNTNATALTNGNKTPFIMDVACVNGNFVSLTCFAEAWLRNANGGAVAMYASSINQSWNSPMLAEDEVTDMVIAQSKITVGGLYYNGSCKMMDTYGNTAGSDGVNMYKTWHIFGDASLVSRTKTPIAMTVTHPSNITSGTTSVSVSTGVNNTLVAITYNNTIYGRGFTNSSGSATITLSTPPTGTLNYTITATAHNRVTYVGTIAQTVASGPWMEVTAANFDDANNDVSEYNESGYFDVTFKNSGTSAATSVTATLTCATSGITITDNSHTISSLAAGATVLADNAFAITIADNVANGTVANFTITMVGASTWTYNFSLTLNAPALAFGSMTISDPTGDNDGLLDPGETATVSILLNNTGAAASLAGTGTLSSGTTGITVVNGSASFTAITAGGNTTLAFTVTAASSMTEGTLATLVFNATAGAYTANKTETAEVGAPLVITIGNGTSSQSYPIDRYYNYSSHEAVYLASEIGTAGTIKSIGFYKASGADVNTIESVTVYMKNTTATTLATGNYSTTGYTQVYSGTWPNTATSGWMEVNLQTQFAYDGTNLSILTIKGNQAYITNYPYWTYTTASATRARQNRSDTEQPASLTASTNLPNLKLAIFPVAGVLYPPQNLAATPGNGYVNLSWQAPLIGTPTGYKVFRDGSLLTTVPGLSYSDNAVVNETTYNYYLTAVYTDGESDPTATVSATPTAVVVTSVILGTGTTASGTSEACPINIYYDSLHGQSVYTKAELNAAGVFGPINITQMGFYVSTVPTLPLPNFIVRMKHTTQANVATWQTAANMVTVYSNSSYLPVAGGYHMLTLSTPFTWNGVDNIVIDTAFSPVSQWSSTGTTAYTTVTSGYRYIRADDADQTSVFTGGATSTNRPNVKLTLLPNASGPIIVTNPTSLTYGDVAVGGNSVQQFTIQNSGDQTLTGSISTPNAVFTVAEMARDEELVLTLAKDIRNTLSFSVAAGTSKTYALTFAPTSASTYSGNVVISSNAVNSTTVNISVSGTGVQMPVDPRYVAEWEPATGTIIAYASGFGLPYSMIADLSTRGQLYVLVTSSTQSTANSLLSSNGVTMSKVTYIVRDGINSYWTRDYGPWTIFDANGEMAIVDFRYNRNRPYDNAVNAVLDDQLGLGYSYMPLVATGGNVMTDGLGKMMSSTLIQTENDGVQNSQVTEYSYTLPQIQSLVQQYLGVDEYMFFTDPLANSSIDHIDCHAKLLDVDKVMIARVPVGHTNYAALEAVVDVWETKTSSYGTPYQIFRVDQTSSNEPYSNSFIYNNKIYVPQWNSTASAADLAAIAAYQAAMPGYTVQGYYHSSFLSDDAIHCRVNTIYDEQMIHLTHVPPASAIANSSVTLSVEITHSNPLNGGSTYIAYRHSTTGQWLTVPLTLVSGNTWTASVPTPANGQTLYYYILATDTAAKTAKMPLCGASDPFEIMAQGGANTAPTIALPDSFTFAEDGSLVVDFSGYVADAETADAGLTLSYSGDDQVNVTIAGLSVTFTADANWFGTDNITFTVSDGTETANDNVNVIVSSVTDPAVMVVTPLSLAYGEVEVGSTSVKTFTITNNGEAALSGSITTPTGYSVAEMVRQENAFSAAGDKLKAVRNTLSYSVASGVTKTYNLTFAPTAAIAYNGNVTVSGDDPANPDDLIAITGMGHITNTPPVIDLPETFAFDENGSLVVDFSQYVNDAQEDELTLTFSGNTFVNVAIDGLSVTFTATADWDGSEALTFTVNDGELEASDTVEIIVHNVNVAPTIALPETFEFDMNGSLVVDFSQYVDDPDGDPLTLNYSGNSNVSVSIDGLTVTFTASTDWYGTEALNFTVSDGVDTASDGVSVTVNLTWLAVPGISVLYMDEATDYVKVQWNAIPNANYYQVWASADPYGTYSFLGETIDVSWNDMDLSHAMRFYQVIASDESYLIAK